MLKVIAFIKVVLVLFLGLTLFMWIVYHASGHNVPAKTEYMFGSLLLSIAALLLVIIIIEKRFTQSS